MISDEQLDEWEAYLDNGVRNKINLVGFDVYEFRMRNLIQALRAERTYRKELEAAVYFGLDFYKPKTEVAKQMNPFKIALAKKKEILG